MEAVFLGPRVTDDVALKRFTRATAFGTAGLIISATPGRLYALTVCNNAAATKYWVQIFDKATAPANADIPIWEGQAGAVTDREFDFGIHGLYCAAGISIALSTTPATLTLAGATDGTAFALYTARPAVLP